MAYNQSDQIYTQDDYNDIRKDPVYAQFFNEADYVLTQDNPEVDDHNFGIYRLSKKPEDEVIEQVTNPWDFIEKLESKGNNFKVLVVHVDRTFSLFNLNCLENYLK